MRLLNLNIGIKIDNSAEVIKLIKDMNSDFVTLQEATRGLETSVLLLYNSANLIKEATDYPYSFFEPLWVASHHKKNRGQNKGYTQNI